ncbi:ATP-binding cassette domain-containing protein [Austwickia chelonae]|uniref:ATP-binding cassette domain-containing protein n=1 Tax=Austwickia chelonae TaxID=100225 RepID=UPI00196751DA|nr:ATP-binding cassette domain-containing protein [Austwickia chelonae]
MEALRKSFGEHHLWSALDLTVASGEMLAIRGASGSGKSTLLSCIGLLSTPDSGRVLIDGADILHTNRRRQRRLRQDTLGYLFQDYALIEESTVRENLDLAARPRAFMPRPDVEHALSRVGLAGRASDPVHLLSGGEQQRVALARLLLKPSRVILADEPTAALDQENEDVVLTLLHELADEGRAVLIATHSDRVAQNCHSVLDLSTANINALSGPTVEPPHPATAQDCNR